MIRWIVTILIVLILAGLAFSAPSWLPELLEPLLADPFLVESATTLAQLILLVLAGLCAIVGVRWAIRGHRSGFQVMDADDLEAAAARAAAEAAVPDPAAEHINEEQPGAGGEGAPEAAAPPNEAAPPGEPVTAPAEEENILTQSLFGPDGAIPPGSLKPNQEQPADEAPLDEAFPEDRELLSEALFGPAGPLPPGSLEPVDTAVLCQGLPRSW